MASPDVAAGHPLGPAIVTAARALVGTRFRAQGRDAEGLDCLGLVLLASARAGVAVVAPEVAPALRGTTPQEAEARLRAAGARRIGRARPGDLLLASPAAFQVHLGIATADGVIEAHAGLGRVVERPLAAGDDWHSAWRLPGGTCDVGEA
ncbi:MAG: peptidoglycan endopeptidase [Sphingomonadaceae bacterium]